MDTGLTREYFLSLISAFFLSRPAWYHDSPLGDNVVGEGLGGRAGGGDSSGIGGGGRGISREGQTK